MQPTACPNNLPRRNRIALAWRFIFQASTIFGIITLAALLYNIINASAGYILLENKVDPATLAVNNVPLENLTKDELIGVLQANISSGLYRRFERDKPFAERTSQEILDLIYERVVEPEVVKTYSLVDSIFRKQAVLQEAASLYPTAELVFKFWFNPRFISAPSPA